LRYFSRPGAEEIGHGVVGGTANAR